MAKQYNRKARQNDILAMVKNSDFVSIKTMIDQLDCSMSTIRSDLVALEKEGQLVRTLGGAKPVWTSAVHQVSDRLSDQAPSKRQIAKYVVENLIPENSTIILDAGSTSFEVASAIADANMSLSVLTCSFLVSLALTKCENVRLFSFGGFYNQDGGYFYDEILQQYAKIMHADIFFMGVNGVSPEVGFTISYRDEAVIKNTLMNISSRTIVLCDSSKIMQNACRVVSDFERVPMMVTDPMADKAAVASLKKAGLEVAIARND